MNRVLDKRMILETRSGSLGRVRELLGRGAAIDRLHRKDGFTPLMRVSYHGHSEIVELLLSCGADPNQTATDGASPLFWATVRGHFAIVEQLLQSGADVNAIRHSGDPKGNKYDGPTPLNIAIANDDIKIAERLIQAGASLDHRHLERDIREYAEWHQAAWLPLLLKKAQVAATTPSVKTVVSLCPHPHLTA